MQNLSMQSPKKAPSSGNAYHAARVRPDGSLQTNRKPFERKGVPRWTIIIAGFALIAVGVLSIRWAAHRFDGMMRAEILLQAKMMAQAVNFKDVAALSGTNADLDSPNYLRLKEQLSLVREANPKCRFIYLVGRKSDGNLFFYVDSEDPGSDDYSPPGQIYEEASEDYYRVFDTAVGNAEGGPYKDPWGTWISAIVPMLYPETNKVKAVLGMDFNAESWKLDVASTTVLWALPSALAILFGIFLLALPARVAWRFC